jgi:DNA repair exonuclease SbcCD ATPase subunit
VKVEAIEEELEKRRRHGNELFGEVKEDYEEFLRVIDVRDYRPTTRYTYGEDEGSYQDLYKEVQEKATSRLEEIEEDLEQNEVDLLKAEYIQELSEEQDSLVEELEQRAQEACEELQSLKRATSVSLVKEAGEGLKTYSERVQDVATVVVDIRRALGPILYAEYELSDAEQDILDAFGRRRDVDPTDLFVSLRKQGYELDWPDFMEFVDHLYRKNRILIRMTRRGG